MNVNFEPIIRGLKSDIFEVQNPFHICRIQLQKKKSGVKKCLEILSIKGRGGGVRGLMEKSILYFHFDYLTISLILNAAFAECNGELQKDIFTSHFKIF